jgi:hypothetical protein
MFHPGHEESSDGGESRCAPQAGARLGAAAPCLRIRSIQRRSNKRPIRSSFEKVHPSLALICLRIQEAPAHPDEIERLPLHCLVIVNDLMNPVRWLVCRLVRPHRAVVPELVTLPVLCHARVPSVAVTSRSSRRDRSATGSHRFLQTPSPTRRRSAPRRRSSTCPGSVAPTP